MSGRTGTRGRIDKRQAILDAAFVVFARRGYAQACVQEIAQEAGVSKPTIYNHLGDKESLFREAMAAVGESVLAENLAIVERIQDGPLDTVLEPVAVDLIRACCGERSRALRRLVNAEITQFPDLLHHVQGHSSHQLGEALAGRLARLALLGRLRPADPAAAAEQFLALLTAPMEARSQLGTREVPDAEIAAVAAAAVDTFLRAYAADLEHSAA
ncbi:TetR/AcrR family transcriptional regulator [Nocardia salmonicida]|uniref:TetR/AcrR family transcriptional regulator n=1 Tax=Nocardia salmonicida TaxID=53431 RepID=UPI00363B084C